MHLLWAHKNEGYKILCLKFCMFNLIFNLRFLMCKV